MPRRGLAVFFGLGLFVLGAFACDSFGGDSSSSSSGGSGGLNDAATSPDVAADAPPAEICGTPKPLDPAQQTLRIYYPQNEEATAFGITADDANVYWLEQRRDKGATTDIYNAKGSSQLRRAPITADATSDVLIKGLGAASEITRIGDQLFVTSRVDNDARLLRVAATCSPSTCEAQELWTAEGVVPARLFPTGPESLVLLTAAGVVYSFEQVLSEKPRVIERGATSDFPGIVVALPFIHAAGMYKAALYSFDNRRDTAQVAPSTPFPTIDGESTFVGASHLAAHCGLLYAFRQDRWFWRNSGSSGSFERWATPRQDSGAYADVYAVRTDDDYIYVASTNAGGIMALSRADGSQIPLYSGNVFNLDVNDRAIMWAEHKVANDGGTIYYRLKR